MAEQLVQKALEHGGTRSGSVRHGVRTDDVAGIVRSFKGEPDVTLNISREGSDESLLLAVSGAKAFVDSPDGVFQFVSRDMHATAKQPLIIAGQETNIESPSELCVETAASIARE